MRGTPMERLMAKVSPEPNCGCWLWTGAYHRQGYGQFALSKSKIVLAHRASWALHHGFMPHPDVKVCHSCDTPECVNPDHLWLGTTADNTRDAARKGRLGKSGARGSKNTMARLDEIAVAKIRLDTRVATEVASDFGVSPSTIYAIRNGSNWGWLKTEGEAA